MKKFIFVAILSLLTLSLSDYGYCRPGNGRGMGAGQGMQPGGGRGMRGQGRGIDGGPGIGQCRRFAFQELNLSNEQQAQLLKVQQQHRSEMAKSMAEMVALKTDLSSKLTADTLDEKTIAQLVNQIGELQKKHLGLRIEFVKSLRQILTPDQLRKLNLETMFGRGMGMGYGGMQGGF